MNAVEIEQAVSQLAEQPFDAAKFPFEFLRAFGNKDVTIKRLRKGDNNASDVPGGLLQRNNIHMVACAKGAVVESLQALRDSPRTGTNKARFILATDGVEFHAEDLTTDDPPVICEYTKFPDRFGFFLPLAGITTVKQIRESAFDIRATGRLNRLYRQLLADNPDWDLVERRPDMNHFMARLIFCFFAEDTGIFNGERLFTRTADQMSERDASNTHTVIETIFSAMNTPVSHDGKPDDRYRKAVRTPRWADVFPYVNGGLFSGDLSVPRFSRIARSYFLTIGGLDWTQINPDIFGSMIQAVADDEERGELGMHYTSVPNILKVLNPLFLDDLREQLEAAGDNLRMLLNLRKRMSRIRVFDPACGSGNFLVIAYKEMRAIEAEINRRRREADRRSDIPLTNFRGIELRDFAAEIARLALIIAEYQADVQHRGQREALAEFLPLDAENWIRCDNALRTDWNAICPPIGAAQVSRKGLFDVERAEVEFENEGGEVYICGNPPYLGAKKKTPDQVRDMEIVGLGGAKLLDYVAAFLVKAAEYIGGQRAAAALVSTSSICQGEQVSLLWPRLLRDLDLKFAYRPFRWSNLAAGNAGVWCTIVGLAPKPVGEKIIFDGDTQRSCKTISPYVIDSDVEAVFPRKSSISNLSPIVMGSNPVDGKRLIFTRDDYSRIVSLEPEAAKYFKRYGGTEEIIHRPHRYCLWIADSDVDQARKIDAIREAIDQCQEYRLTAGQDARRVAKYPHRFSRSTFRDVPAVHVGNTIGSKFDYIPATLMIGGYVSSHTAFTLYEPAGFEFALIVSKLHRVWAETIAGRLGDGVRYAATVVFNTFPVPTLTDQNKADLTGCAEDILLAREAHWPATIADLYDPDAMPDDLRHAHERNDETLERIYVGRRFRNDTERLEKLFELYTKMIAAEAKTKGAAHVQ